MGSSFGRSTGYPEDFGGIPQLLRAKARIVPRLNHERFLQNPFESIMLQFDAI
jgi:hypothetical protein